MLCKYIYKMLNLEVYGCIHITGAILISYMEV